MAEDVLVTYKVGESIYQIPASNQEKLLEKYPDAERMSTFNYGGEDYYIPNQNAEKFISKYPDAEPMDNDANIFMQSYRGKQNRGIPTITVTEGEENGLTSTLAESEDVSQKPKASNGDIATPQPVNDTFFKEDAATQQQNIAKDKKDRAIAEQIYNTFESKPELFKTVEAREKFYDLLASKGYANAFSIGESMVSGDSRFDQRDEKESYIPNAGIDYVIGRRRHDDIVNTPVMRDPAVQLKLHTTFTNAGEGLQQTINTLNAGGDNEQQRSMAKDFSLLQTRLSSIQKAEKEGRINTQGAKDAIKNLSDAAANIRKKYKNYIDGVTEEGEQKKTFEEKITGESIEGKKDFAGISLDTKPTQQKVKGLSKDAREKVLSTLDDIESLYKKFSSVSAQSNAAYVNRPENQYQLATALSEMGKFKESNKILGELLNKNAASYQIYQAAAYNYYQLGDNAAARSMQIAAQQRQPISDIPSNEGGDTTGLDMGLGNPANPQYGNQGSPTPASEEMGLIAGALRHYTPLYSNAANISEGWMHALEKLKKGGIDYSKLQQAKNFGDVVKLGVGEGARTALNTIAGFAEGLFAYSMNTTPVGLAFVEGTQGLTAEGAKATIGKVGAETFNYFRGLKGSDKVTPDEAVAAIMMPVTTVLQGKEMRGAEIPEWAKDVGLIADVIAMHLFMGAVSRLRGTEEAKTAQDILDGKEVTVEHANNLIYSIIKMTNEEGGVIYKIQHEYAEKLKELEKTVADFPETREVLQPEIEATNKKLEDIQGTLLHHDILTESSRVEIQGKEKALSALKDAIEKQKEGSAAKPLLEERARQLQEEIDGLEAERVQKTKDAVDAHARESFAKLADEVLDIRFGDYVDYGGIKGRVERRPDGVVVVTTDGKEVLVEGGFSGKRLKDLGLKKIEEPKGGEPKGGEPKTEPQPETEVEQGVAEVKAPDVKFNFEENTVTVDGKKYTYDGVGVDKDGNTTSIRVIDENGNVRHLRNEEVVFEIELQKETAELGMIEKSEVEAAAKELNIKEQKNEKETRGTPEKQQGVVEKLQPAEQAKAVEENKGEQKQEQLKTQDDAVQEQKTKGVDVRQQAADGEAVGERNAKGQEITDNGEAEKIKKQIAEENAKSEWQKEQEAIDNDSSLSEEEKEKKKIESTAKALEDADKTNWNDVSKLFPLKQGVFKERSDLHEAISEAYHKAKADGRNPELVKAVEDLLGTQKENLKRQSTALEDQIEAFGVPKDDVKATSGLLTKLFEGLKKAGLTATETVGEWVGIGKGTEKPYSLKIDGKDTQVKNVQPEVVNGFYSPLEKIITESKFDKLPAKQWAEKYANSEEAKWTGLKDWLAKQQGSVSKADIQQYLKDNRIQVVEVVKTQKDYRDDWDKENDNPKDLTKFSQYQLEGEKENYKEVLVTMPSKEPKIEPRKASDYSIKVENESQFTGQRDVIILKNGVESGRRYGTRASDEEIINDYISKRDAEDLKQKKKEGQFKSSHFDEPNILVHLRMNTRTDADGKKVLFLEEVQSDWGQKGKKEGFVQERKFIQPKTDGENKWDVDGVKILYFEKGIDGKKYRTINEKNEQVWSETLEEASKIANKTAQDKEKYYLGTPTAPFVTDTNAWTKLGLKVALKEAVAQGATKIAWTTGEQQVGRYEDDFRKQVDKIETYKRISADVPSVHVIASKGSSQVFDHIIPINGKTIVSGKEVDLEDVVGKEIANKIRNSEEKHQSFEGDALTIGGKGMEDFYGKPSDAIRSKSFTIKKEGELFAVKDEKGKTIRTFKQENEANKFKENYGLGIVGNVAKSLFKQEPKTVDIFQSDKLASGWSVTVKDKQGYVSTQMFDSKSKGLAWLSEQEGLEVLSSDAEGKNYSTQHSIDITPELKASVEGGQPLFKDAEAQYRIDSGKNIIEAIKDFNKSKNKARATVALIHEIMHPTVVAIIDGAKEGNAVGQKHTKTIVEEYNKANPDKKITLEQMIEGNDAFVNGRTTPEYRAVQEFIAEAWEKYHHEGAKGFSKAFQEALDAITEAFRQVYKSLTGVTLTPELRKMFDELLGMEEVKQEQKQEKPAIEKTLVEEHGVAKEDAAIVTSVLDKLNKGLQSMGVSFDITKGLQLGKGKEGSEASAHAQFRIDKGKRIVEILKSDLPAKEKATAVLHEVGHLSLHELLQQHIDGSTPEIKKALDTMIKAFNESGRSGEAKKRLGGDVTIEKLIEEHNAFKEQGEKINAASTEALSDNIPNFRDFHEFITDSLNKYLKDGTAGFGKEFDAVLQKIKELLVHVYDTVRGGTLEGLTVSPELKQVFDRMLGKDVDLFKEPEKPQAKPLGEVKVDMPTTDEQGRVMSLSEALRMAKEQGQIKGKETGGLKHSEGMSEADFVAMYQKQQQDNLRAELLGAEDVDVAHTAGEERISQRQRKWKAVTVKEAKKIIEGLDPKYESTNAESVNSLVDRIFAPFQDYIKAGVDVFDVASEYAKSIYPKDRTEPYAAQKAAVATVLMTKAANELRMGFRFADSAAAGSERGVFKRGTLEYDIAAESLKKFEDYLSGDKRVDATALAFANSHINPNEVYALLDAIDNSRKKVMGEKAKSGRTKEEVAKEMRTLKPTAEEVDTAAEKATAKTTKVKPKRSLFSGSTTKKTRSTISVERKKSAKDKLKSGLSKIQAAIPSAKPTPKKGGLTEEPPLPKGVVEGVKDIAEAAISEGHYTQEAIKDYVAEKTKGILDRATSDGIIDKAWDGEIKQKSGAARADEVSYAIVKALKTGKGDAITKQLGEALLMQDAEYDPSSKTKRQQATARLAEILKDPAAAEARLNAAINMVVNQSIVNPKMLDYLGLDPVDFLASKENPHGMTMEQFEAFSRDMLKKKLYDMAQDFMGHGVHEQRVLPLPKKRIKPSASEVKKFIKDFYDNPEMTDSMLETALTDHFDITPEQATAIASKVRGELADIVASRSQKKIDALAEEISDGDRTKKKRVTDMVVKALTTNGAFGDIPFSEKMAAALSNRSVAPADINKILAYGRMANATDSSLLKAFYMRKAATILSKYDMSAASFLFQGLYEQGVVNILGNPRTSILTASLSMLKTMPFDVVRMFVTRPSTFVRAVRFSKLIGSKGIGSVTGEGFRAILNGVETVRNRAEIETKPQIRRESANKQARLTSWRYLRKASLSGNDPKRAQLFILKALQSLTFSGGSLRQNIGGKTYEFSPTHWLVNLISGLDVVVKAGLMNLHNYYNAERFIRESGIKFGTSEFTKKMSEMLTTDPLIFDAIDKQVNMEVADAMKNGIPLPKDYVHERKTQLYQEYVDKDVVSQSLFEINKSALIGIPRTWLGAHTYNFIRSNTEIKDNEKTVNAAVKYFFGSALYFSRVGINVIERRGRGIPFYNMFLAAAPYEFTIDASGKVVRRTTESGKVIRRVENKRDFAFGILQATTTTALAVMLINNIFQQEDLKDEKGNPVIDPATGEPVKHWVLNPSSPIRFHGRKKALTTTEKNAVPAMCIELTNVEDPDKRFWKFEWFPESWYPMLFMLGEESDDIRYKEEKLQVGGTEKDNSMLRSVQEEPTSMLRIVTTAGIGAFNASFTTPAQTADEASRLISQDKKRDAAATIAYRLTGQPFITTVNPRLAGQIADAYDYFKEREKTYVKLSIENTNIRSAVSNMAQYSMNQVWAGRYLVNNEDNKYTIYDAHGQPMEREPGDLLFLPAMFSEDMYYGWAEHIYKSPLYKIYMDDNGNFDESVIAIPNRIGWNDKVSVSDMVKQQVRQKTREYYGQLVTKFYGKLLSTPYEERGEFIKELWKAAVNEAKTEYGAKEKTVEGAVGVMQRKNMTDGNAKEE